MKQRIYIENVKNISITTTKKSVDKPPRDIRTIIITDDENNEFIIKCNSDSRDNLKIKE